MKLSSHLFNLYRRAAGLVMLPAKGPGGYNSGNSAPHLSGPGSLLVPPPAGIFTNRTNITSFSRNGTHLVINATNGPGSSGNYTFTAAKAVFSGARQQFHSLSNTNF